MELGRPEKIYALPYRVRHWKQTLSCILFYFFEISNIRVHNFQREIMLTIRLLDSKWSEKCICFTIQYICFIILSIDQKTWFR